MSTYKIKIDKSKINDAVKKAFRETALLYGAQLTKAISDPVWEWPRGESPRDIVNMGQLRSSQRMEYEGPTSVVYTWSTEYASYVYFGAVLRNGTILPSRKWDQHALKKINLERTYSTLFKAFS